jgi:flagellar hook-associated protein 3 FlgL
MMRTLFDVGRDGLAAINTAADRLAAAQLQVATGRRLNAVSDDPAAAALAVREHATLGAVDAYTRTRDAAAGRLAVADTALSGMIDALSAAIVAGTGAQGSHVTAAARAAAAAHVTSLRDSLVADLNTTFQGAYLFSGSRSGVAPYALVAGTWTYQGDAAAQQVEVERQRLVTVSFDGRAIAQGTDTADMFTSLDRLATAIAAGDNPGMAAEIAALQRAFDRVSFAQGRLGADERALDRTQANLTTLRQAATARQAALEDANMADAITRLTRAQDTYRAALGSVSTAERQSLLDYLR